MRKTKKSKVCEEKMVVCEERIGAREIWGCASRKREFRKTGKNPVLGIVSAQAVCCALFVYHPHWGTIVAMPNARITYRRKQSFNTVANTLKKYISLFFPDFFEFFLWCTIIFFWFL